MKLPVSSLEKNSFPRNPLSPGKKYETIVVGHEPCIHPTVQLPALVGYISGRTGLNESEVRMVLEELSAAITFFNRQGQGVKLVKLGTYQGCSVLKGLAICGFLW